MIWCGRSDRVCLVAVPANLPKAHPGRESSDLQFFIAEPSRSKPVQFGRREHLAGLELIERSLR